MSDGLPIETVRLSKTYARRVQALSDLDLRVERGEVFGFLGPNGAGKSTTIRLLLGLIRPTAGSARILGLDARRRGRRGARAGRLPAGRPAPLRSADRRRAARVARPAARRGSTPDSATRSARGFDVVLDRPIRQLSKGNRQKLGLVQAFMHRPDLLVLDEPTSGLDPLLQSEFRALVARDGRGRTHRVPLLALARRGAAPRRPRRDHPRPAGSSTSTPSTACASARSATSRSRFAGSADPAPFAAHRRRARRERPTARSSTSPRPSPRWTPW